MVGLRGPYATRLSIPIGISYSSGIALGYKCARYGFAVFIGGGWALESTVSYDQLKRKPADNVGLTRNSAHIRKCRSPSDSECKV